MKFCAPVFSLQIAYNSGYIKVDWKRVEKDFDKAKEQLNQGPGEKELDTFVKKVILEGHYQTTRLVLRAAFSCPPAPKL